MKKYNKIIEQLREDELKADAETIYDNSEYKEALF